MKTELIKISKLKLLEKNPRRITKEQMDKLCRSIESDPTFLECRPVLVNCLYYTDENGEINEKKIVYNVYAGNQRVRAAKKIGMKEIPCIVEYDLDEDTVKKRIVQDNSHFGTFDFDILANEWSIDVLIDCGFTPDDLIGPIGKVEEKREKKSKEKCPACGK